jgi:hypothetical protein
MSALYRFGIIFAWWRWRKRKAMTKTTERAIDVEWLGELVDLHLKGEAGQGDRNNIRRQIARIEAEYAVFKDQFPDLDRRLSDARVVLTSTTET